MKVTIKKIHEESPSTRWVDEAKIGQILKALPPLGNFTIVPSEELERELIMFGAGSGITPLFSMLKSVLMHEPKSKIVLFYSNKNESSVIFKNELTTLGHQYPERFRVVHIHSQPLENWKGLTGRITNEKALELLSAIENVNLQNADYYLCGPDGMMQGVILALDQLKVEHKKIHMENYVVQIIDEDEEIENAERNVTIFIKGEKHNVKVKPSESIMEKAFQLGLEIPSSCQHGECGTCRARLLSGKLKLVSQTTLSEEDIENGYCLTCVGYPASDNVVILYEDPFED